MEYPLSSYRAILWISKYTTWICLIFSEYMQFSRHQSKWRLSQPFLLLSFRFPLFLLLTPLFFARSSECSSAESTKETGSRSLYTRSSTSTLSYTSFVKYKHPVLHHGAHFKWLNEDQSYSGTLKSLPFETFSPVNGECIHSCDRMVSGVGEKEKTFSNV